MMSIIQGVTVFTFAYSLVKPAEGDCFLCNLGLLLVPLLAIVCLLNKKINCALNTTFTIPLFIYAFYLSGFNNHPPAAETIYYSTWWLLSGLFLLFIFSESVSKVTLYFILSLVTIGFQLFKTHRLSINLNENSLINHPLVILTAAFTAGILLRIRYQRRIEVLSGKLDFTQKGISKVFQESKFLIARIKTDRDEAGNIEKLWIEKVNNAFESAFKINLYEVQGQEAAYVFELVFRELFDINKMLLFENRKTKEFHAKNLERWYKINIIKPDSERVFVILEDITKTKKKIAELEQGKKRYKVLLEAIPDMFFVIGKDGMYEDFVIKESDLFKLEDANIVGSTIYDVGFPENMAKKIHQCIHTCIANNSLETIEYSLTTPNGIFMYEMRLAKLNARSVISIARDITKRKTAEIGLEKAIKKAEESDRLKSAFLSNLSHEIRTPLNIITNFTRMLTEADMDDEEKTEISDAIMQNGSQLLNMIDNTVHLSQIETGTVILSPRFCKINTLIRDVYNWFLPNIPDNKKLKINLKISVPNPAFGFISDPNRLNDVLKILVDNAVKYTPKGEIDLGYEMLRNEQVKFYVSDTGIGIPEEEAENIFSRFYRVQNKINERTSGSGLGLPIARHYVTLLGGELQLESTPGKGTRFWFSLPFREGEGFLRIVN